MGMKSVVPRLVILLSPPADRRRLPQVMTWLRWLVPAAVLLVGPARLPEIQDAEVMNLDCSDGFDGPLDMASVLAAGGQVTPLLHSAVAPSV